MNQTPEHESENLKNLDSIESTFSENGEEIYFVSGYGAKEIALNHVKEHGGTIYVNNISRNIKRRDLNVSVAYAVAKSPIYTLRPPNPAKGHDAAYRAYWPQL